jgi:hypothetical protein
MNNLVERRMLGRIAAGLVLMAHGCAGPGPRATRAETGAAAPRPAAATASSECCTAFERGVLEEPNRARTDPARAAAELEARLAHYRGNIYHPPGVEVGLRTIEGASALREAVRVLRSMRPVTPLRLSRGMSAGAADHVRDQGPRGGLGHQGTDRSAPALRISRYGRWFGVVSENIQYGRAATPRDVVAELLIDDGVPDRGHRRNIFDPVIRVAGVACGPHALYGRMCVIVHAADYAEASSARASGR